MGSATILTANDYKKAYNILLKRLYKAEEFFKTHTEEEIDRWLPLATDIINTMGYCIEVLEKKFNIVANGRDIELGFDIEEWSE